MFQLVDRDHTPQPQPARGLLFLHDGEGAVVPATLEDPIELGRERGDRVGPVAPDNIGARLSRVGDLEVAPETVSEQGERS